jgi:uncharacterized protein (DUF4415 family)
MSEKRRYIDAEDEAQDLDAEWFRTAKPTDEVAELSGILRHHGKPGRPPLPQEARKQRVTLYLDRDVVARLKDDGKGWQTRANAALRRALGL